MGIIQPLVRMMFYSVFSLFFFIITTARADCPGSDAFNIESDTLGCVYADPWNRYDNFAEALQHCRENFGSSAELVELLAAAEAVNEQPELSKWYTGLRDDDDDG